MNIKKVEDGGEKYDFLPAWAHEMAKALFASSNLRLICFTKFAPKLRPEISVCVSSNLHKLIRFRYKVAER